MKQELSLYSSEITAILNPKSIEILKLLYENNCLTTSEIKKNVSIKPRNNHFLNKLKNFGLIYSGFGLEERNGKKWKLTEIGENFLDYYTALIERGYDSEILYEMYRVRKILLTLEKTEKLNMNLRHLKINLNKIEKYGIIKKDDRRYMMTETGKKYLGCLKEIIYGLNCFTIFCK